MQIERLIVLLVKKIGLLILIQQEQKIGEIIMSIIQVEQKFNSYIK